ncbi:MAG: phosphate ABC transporter permease subunit PstC [Candidatus Micrarchaeota archaeon]|nr:phosphate ABC transporter permease subunit PstC [Candidatus Micrarchaeota archaeon]
MKIGKDPDGLAELLVKISAYSMILVVFFIFFFLFFEGIKIFNFESVQHFFLGQSWQPTSSNPRFEIASIIIGSLFVTAGALLLSVPVALGCAIYLSEVAPPSLSELLKPVIEILAGIPSVVIGFFGLTVVVPAVASIFGIPSGLTLLSGILVLAIMVLPTIETISEDALRSVPRSYREASAALGATDWETIHKVVLPAAMPGITVAILLGFGRAIGETMVVLMVTGNAAIIPTSVFDPIRTMTATIAAEMGEAPFGSPHYFALFMIAATLFVISFMVNSAANLLIKRGSRYA